MQWELKDEGIHPVLPETSKTPTHGMAKGKCKPTEITMAIKVNPQRCKEICSGEG